jgi:hypothetical protein
VLAPLHMPSLRQVSTASPVGRNRGFQTVLLKHRDVLRYLQIVMKYFLDIYLHALRNMHVLLENLFQSDHWLQFNSY